jgi:AraC-like DNA-binding protein
VSTRFVCGYLACDARPFNPLLDQLPPTIKAGGPDSGWLGQFIRLAALESAQKSAGSETVLARLSELMFIEVVRRYAGEASLEGGWLSGLRDRLVGRSLSLLHADPARDWTIDDLARATGTSRSVLAERFHALVGIPPMQYLARWRMQIAAGLISGGANVAEAAAEVGYGSEATFSRAFKKVVGASPSAWRSRRGQASAAGGRETPHRAP